MLHVTAATGTAITIIVDGETLLVNSSLSAGDNLFDSAPLPLDSRGNKYLNISAGVDINYTVTGGTADVVGYVEDY